MNCIRGQRSGKSVHLGYWFTELSRISEFTKEVHVKTVNKYILWPCVHPLLIIIPLSWVKCSGKYHSHKCWPGSQLNRNPVKGEISFCVSLDYTLVVKGNCPIFSTYPESFFPVHAIWKSGNRCLAKMLEIYWHNQQFHPEKVHWPSPKMRGL